MMKLIFCSRCLLASVLQIKISMKQITQKGGRQDIKKRQITLCQVSSTADHVCTKANRPKGRDAKPLAYVYILIG